MPSSTSSSETTARVLGWRAWALAVAVAVGSGVVMETAARARGAQPGVDDSVLLRRVRAAVDHASHGAIMLLGSSRVLWDVDDRVLSQMLGGGQVLNLAQAGQSCVPTLDEIARHSHFSGLVVCGLEPSTLFTPLALAPEDGGSAPPPPGILSPIGRFDEAASDWLKGHLAILQVGPGAVVRAVLSGESLAPTAISLGDRLISRSSGDGVKAALITARGIEDRGNGTLDAGEITALAHRVNELAAIIERRGGRVVLVEMPSSGAVLAAEREQFPRYRHWAVFLNGSRLPFLSDDDVGGSEKCCPDGSHLDPHDAPEYTRALAAALVRRVDSLQ